MILYCCSVFQQYPTRHTPSSSCTSYHLSGGRANMVRFRGLFWPSSKRGERWVIFDYLLIQSIMEHKQKILEYYSTGRYECDLDFHIDLLKILKEMDLHEWQPKLQHQTQLIKKIKQLTDMNNVQKDDDFQDQELITQTYKIKSLIGSIKTNDIHAIIQECEELEWEGYQRKIEQRMKGKTNYDQILERIKSTIHSQQFRIDSMLFATVFEMVNGQSVNQLIPIYSNAVQSFLSYLTDSNQKIQAITQGYKISNICSLPKTKHFVITNYSILKTCLRYCEIIKILVGKNNLSLKFTVVKKEMQKLIKSRPQWKVSDEKQDIFAVLAYFKQYLKKKCNFDKNKICKWCIKLMKGEKIEHSFCRYIVQNKNTFRVKND